MDDIRACCTCGHHLGGGACRANLEAECAAGGYEAWEPKREDAHMTLIEREHTAGVLRQIAAETQEKYGRNYAETYAAVASMLLTDKEHFPDVEAVPIYDRLSRMEREIIVTALDKWGRRNQMIVLVEELSELQQAICKQLREDAFNDPIIVNEAIYEELADVEIMLDTLRMTLGTREIERVNDWREKKLARMQARIEGKA